MLAQMKRSRELRTIDAQGPRTVHGAPHLRPRKSRMYFPVSSGRSVETGKKKSQETRRKISEVPKMGEVG